MSTIRSFRSFKETLKPCTNSTQPSSLSLSQQQQQEDRSIIPRKPPKSSLSRQLLRLGDSFELPETQKPPLKQEKVNGLSHAEKIEEDGDVEDVEEEEEEKVKKIDDFGRPKLGRFQFDHTGPYEPLVLSLPGELPAVQVPASINCRLLEHQREGVTFLYKLYRKNHGGVLGDDIGDWARLFKPSDSLLPYIIKMIESITPKENHARKLGPVLIICPTSVIQNWETEFSRWASFAVSLYHGANRNLILDKMETHGVEILITSFDTFRIHGGILSAVKWEIVIVDEAHRLKNEKSKLYAACLQVGTHKRIGLTGTVMQNKIMELFNLFDWVAPGSLGTREHFREFYDEPLKHGQRSTAPERFVRVADERKEHLAAVLGKYMLRRTKEETIGHLMMGKEDNVVFCAMSELQKRVYRRMLQLPDVQCLINKDLPCSCGSPLKQVECCKRIVPDGIIWPYLHRDNPEEGCDSCPYCLVLPCLIKLQQISNHLELIKPNTKDEPDKQKKDAEFASAVFGPDIDLVGGNAPNESFMGLSDVKDCGKMRALEKLMCSWASRGDKILLFSYSVRMLDILEKFLIRKGYSFSRLDGSTPTNLRQSLVDDFNSSPSKQVFLISTRAGGLGLNLVSANRVIIFDPNWNPAQDLQAQDRSFRFGQKRHVVVFRLLAAGSFEELVYSRQVYKQQLSNIVVSGKMEKRYFKGVQDCKQFQGELFGICNLFRDLSDKLFTSEIVELQEKQCKEKNYTSSRQNLVELGTYSNAQEQACPTVPSRSECIKPRDNEKVSLTKPILDDLGILYAHRNEDVVNLRPGGKRKMDEVSRNPRLTEVLLQTKTLNKAAAKKKNRISSRYRKKVEYSLLAQFKGMGEIEFSRWILSATSMEREKVLCDFKKKRGKMPNG